jgi:hypothetical protein
MTTNPIRVTLALPLDVCDPATIDWEPLPNDKPGVAGRAVSQASFEAGPPPGSRRNKAIVVRGCMGVFDGS